MPEIDLFLFDLGQILKLFPKSNSEFEFKMRQYEQANEEEMERNRLNLFGQFGYTS